MKKITIILSLLITSLAFAQVETHDDVMIGKGSPAYGVKIKVNYTSPGGWARGFHITNNNNTEKFISFGAFGSISNNTSHFSRGYIGRNYNDTFMNFLPNGNVGIGTSSPTQKLEVDGFVKFDHKGSNHSNIQLGHDGNDRIFADNSPSNYYGGGMFFRVTADPSLNTPNGYLNVMTLSNKGTVGIGTNKATEKLTVNGKILCEEVEVILDVPADYVFQKYYTGTSTLKTNYIMPTLAEVEAYTKANHHLPEVPSAATIKEEGLQLKQMTNLLLQKVEELTLYTIEQEKRINALEAKLTTQK